MHMKQFTKRSVNQSDIQTNKNVIAYLIWVHLIKYFSCSTGTRYGKKTAKGCPSGSKFFHDGDNSVKNMDDHVLRLEYSCERGQKIKWSSSSILSSKNTANSRWGKLCFSLFYVVAKYFWSLPMQF